MDEFESMEGYQSRDEFEHMERYQSPAQEYTYGQQEQAVSESPGDAEPGGARGSAPPPEKKHGTGILQLAALALLFGVFAGASFAGTLYGFGRLTGSADGAVPAEASVSGADLNIAEDTESTVPSIGRAEGSGRRAAQDAAMDVSDIVEQTMPSIVSIATVSKAQINSFFFGGTREYEQSGCGSGIIISQDEENLYIATNNHVVAGATTLTVMFADGETADAQIKGADASSDLAVAAVALQNIGEKTKQEIRVAAFGDSSKLKMGQTAIAIGNALGYGQSVTAGVISALDRKVTVRNETDGSTTTNLLVQTSAAINPGNSGGALLNANGEVIGITSVKYSETSVEGMGYAIPSKTAVPIVKQLITREIVTRENSGYLGVFGMDVAQEEMEAYNMPQGFYIERVVKGSAADQAGLIHGDIIVGFDGRNIKSMEEMQELMQYLPAGTLVEIRIQRAKNGKYEEQTVEVTLGSKE